MQAKRFDEIKDGEKDEKNVYLTNLGAFYDNLLFYKEEYIEIRNKNKCTSGHFPVDSNTDKEADGTTAKKDCVSCENYCNTKDDCNKNECKIYCATYCEKNNSTDVSKSKCGGITNNKKDEKPLKYKFDEIKTPVEEETIFPDFSYLFKSSVKIFFILIMIYIGYIFYKLFNESILTFGNIFWRMLDGFYYTFIRRNNLKAAQYYQNVIQNKYNRVIRKTMNI
jgi:hypothetical protein